jgi:hypothetical protein
MVTVGRALAAVGAVDLARVEGILTDFDLAVRLRQLGRGHADTAARVVQGPSIRYLGLGPAVRPARAGPQPPGPAPAGTGAPGGFGGVVPPGTGAPGRPGPAAAGGKASRVVPPGSGRTAEDGRFVPVGRTVPFREGAISGELCLMSYAQTSMGARFIAAWNVRTSGLDSRLSPENSGLIPFEDFAVTDDRGARCRLDDKPGSDPHWNSEISVRPAPPRDIRWLDVAGPGHPAVRIGLGPAIPSSAGDKPQVSDVKLSPGEHLLILLAERLLTSALQAPGRLRPRTAAPLAPRRSMAAALGDVVAALEAADVLSPLSPVPGRLATLCASLDLDRHGLTQPAAAVLPRPRLSLLAHFQRRKPEPAQMRDAYAPLATTLPELDGIRLALLGLLHAEESSSLFVLARGPDRGYRYGPLDIDLAFPMSVWLRDSGGRRHAARSDRRHRGGRENTIRLRLVPPLTRPADWAEIIIGGQSAEVRTTLPLRWEYPP